MNNLIVQRRKHRQNRSRIVIGIVVAALIVFGLWSVIMYTPRLEPETSDDLLAQVDRVFDEKDFTNIDISDHAREGVADYCAKTPSKGQGYKIWLRANAKWKEENVVLKICWGSATRFHYSARGKNILIIGNQTSIETLELNGRIIK